jgi:hypothetical protein
MRGFLDDPCFHKGANRVDAISLLSRPTILDGKCNALLIATPATKLITTAAALPRLSPHDRCRSAFLSIRPRRDGLQRHRCRAWISRRVFASKQPPSML